MLYVNEAIMNAPLLRTLSLRLAKISSRPNVRIRPTSSACSAMSAACTTCVTYHHHGNPQPARSSCLYLTSHTSGTSITSHSFFSKKKRLHCFEIGSVGLHSKNLLGPECCRHFTNTVNGSLDCLTFETMVEDMLESLLDFFEQLGDEENVHTDFDVTYSSGVLTVHFGPNHGTYVINKQTPNKQIWLSSPTSGPKRYDLMGNDWVYSHDGVPMLRLLSEEISTILGKSVNLYKVIKLKET